MGAGQQVARFVHFIYYQSNIFSRVFFLCHSILDSPGKRARDAAALYLSVVSPAIHAPYVFSDHANKAYDRQHAYLKRTAPELWARDWTHPEMELAVQRALDQRGVAPDVCARVVALAHDADRAIVRAMALATTAARALHN